MPLPADARRLERMYRTMVLIRQAEERLVRPFAEGRMPGFIHSSIGEAAAAGPTPAAGATGPAPAAGPATRSPP